MVFEAEIYPGRGLGPFYLGISINEAIQQAKAEYRDLARCTIVYDVEDPYRRSILLVFESNGFSLEFDSKTQQCYRIDVFDWQKLQLLLDGRICCDQHNEATFESIRQVFDCLMHGYDSELGNYISSMPGLALHFAIPKQYQDGFSCKQLDLERDFVLPDKSPPLLTHLLIYSGSSRKKVIVQSILQYMENVIVRPDFGIMFADREFEHVKFGDSPQDVMMVLGRPDDIYFKTTSSIRSSSCYPIGFFFNYYQRGIDVFFESDHKILLHANVPGHYEFSRYNTCKFRIKLQTTEQGDSRPEQPPASIDDLEQIHLDDGQDLETTLHDNETGTILEPLTKFFDLAQPLLSSFNGPVVFNRGSSPNASNPFPSTKLFSKDNLVFEVTDTGHISLVTIFKPG